MLVYQRVAPHPGQSLENHRYIQAGQVSNVPMQGFSRLSPQHRVVYPKHSSHIHESVDQSWVSNHDMIATTFIDPIENHGAGIFTYIAIILNYFRAQCR